MLMLQSADGVLIKYDQSLCNSYQHFRLVENVEKGKGLLEIDRRTTGGMN